MPAHEDVIDIAVDDGHIAGTLLTPATRVPGVLFVHGWGGSQEQYLARARAIAALGCVCLTFDLRGHARTQPQYETVSREKNLGDAVAAYDVLAANRNVDASAIAVVGSSYGGYLAALLSSTRMVKWLAMRAPALYMDSGWDLPKRQLHRDQDLVAYRAQLVPAAENRALRACAAFQGDVLVVESELDIIVPHAVISSYLEASIQARSLTYRVIQGADHGLSDEAAQHAYTGLLVSWMSEMVLGTRAGNPAEPAPTAAEESVPEESPGPE